MRPVCRRSAAEQLLPTLRRRARASSRSRRRESRRPASPHVPSRRDLRSSVQATLNEARRRFVGRSCYRGTRPRTCRQVVRGIVCSSTVRARSDSVPEPRTRSRAGRHSVAVHPDAEHHEPDRQHHRSRSKNSGGPALEHGGTTVPLRNSPLAGHAAASRLVACAFSSSRVPHSSSPCSGRPAPSRQLRRRSECRSSITSAGVTSGRRAPCAAPPPPSPSRGTKLQIRLSCPMDFEFRQLAGPRLALGLGPLGGRDDADDRLREAGRLQAARPQHPELRSTRARDARGRQRADAHDSRAIAATRRQTRRCRLVLRRLPARLARDGAQSTPARCATRSDIDPSERTPWRPRLPTTSRSASAAAATSASTG